VDLYQAQSRRKDHDGYNQNWQTTLADLPVLLRYRRAMAEKTDGADRAATNWMIAALDPYLRAAMPEGRWLSWITELGGCRVAVRLKSFHGCLGGWTQPRDTHGYPARTPTLHFAVGVSDDQLTHTIIAGVANVSKL
jgi:hypothetical protein